VVIEAAVSAFGSVFRHREKDLIYGSSKSLILLNYRDSRALFISLFTALENALKYGKTGRPVKVVHSQDELRDILTISNEIPHSFADADAFVQEQRAKWEDENSELSRTEGGSGLYKIHNLLVNSSRGFDFDIKVTDVSFEATVVINHEYFDSRRQSVEAGKNS
jgi:hypothetical protein